ncbi:MAG: serine hydrolase [Rhodospirillaceae bacterium]|nr:serine hydrolase [Rhodospirillaceae bacterium]
MKNCLVVLALLPAVAWAQAPTPAPAVPASGMTKEEIQKKIEWVREVQAQGFEFWYRIANMPDSAAFRQPQDWYNPMALVDGGLRPYLPVAGPDEAPTIDPKAIAAARDYAMARETQAFIVYHRGKIRAQSYMDGYTDTSAISSHSWVKTLHGILAGFAVTDGAIQSLDQPIGTWITEWKDDPRGAITVRQVLHNTTGLEEPDLRETDPTKSLGLQLVEGTDMVATVLAHKLADPPGTAFSHNNVNTQLLGMILHRATGVPFDKYLSQKLWRPVGAQRGALRRDRNYGGNIVSYCCFLSAPSDWMRVAHLLLKDGLLPDGTRLLPDGWVAEMKTASAQNPNYGLHIWVDGAYQKYRKYMPDLPDQFANIHSEPFAVDDMFYFDGGGKVRIWMSPKLDLIVLRMGFPPPRDAGFDEAFMPNAIIRGIKG